MFDGLLYAALYGFLLAFAIGPVFFTLIETSITKGFKAGLFFDLGAQTADIIFILIAYLSVRQWDENWSQLNLKKNQKTNLTINFSP